MNRPPLLLWVLLLLAPTVAPVAAQSMEAPSIPVAETAFDNGLRAYQVGQYEEAVTHFRRAADANGYNQRTTAARLMEGKARYAAGDLAGAASAMTAFLRTYPRSRYVEDARALRRAAQDRMEGQAGVPEPTDLGVALPMSEDDVFFTQALFNGVRIAVDEHNAADPAHPVRMVFRDTEGTANGARQAIEQLAQVEVEVAVGPLYSGEAAAAGEAAERERVALVAPLATDANVSAGRRYVFQANPTFAQRGEIMARYVAGQGSGRSIGVIAQTGTMGATMGEAFRREVERAGDTVPFVISLPNEGAWFRLPEILGDSLRLVEALYLPVSGADAPEYAAGALRGLDQILPEGARGRLRVLGNTEWGQLEASRERASQYGTALTSDFYVDEGSAAVEAFDRRYRALAGIAPDRLAYAGYDVARMVLEQLAVRRSEASMADALREARPFEGLAHRIYFAGGSVNEAMFILGYRDGRLVVLD